MSVHMGAGVLRGPWESQVKEATPLPSLVQLLWALHMVMDRPPVHQSQAAESQKCLQVGT
jgi:hypothetical protein